MMSLFSRRRKLDKMRAIYKALPSKKSIEEFPLKTDIFGVYNDYGISEELYASLESSRQNGNRPRGEVILHDFLPVDNLSTVETKKYLRKWMAKDLQFRAESSTLSRVDLTVELHGDTDVLLIVEPEKKFKSVIRIVGRILAFPVMLPLYILSGLLMRSLMNNPLGMGRR